MDAMKSCKERRHSSVEAPGFDHTGDILESFAESYSLKCGINHIFLVVVVFILNV